jgi:hypothetical protein
MTYFNHPLLRIPLLYGLAAGIAVFLFFLGLHAMGVEALYVILKYPLYFGIHLILMIAAVWYYRRSVGKGLLHMWEGLTICYVVNSVAALVGGWLIYGFVQFVDPSEFTGYIKLLVELQESDKARFIKEIGAAEYDALLAQTRNTQPDVLPKDIFLKSFFYGILPILIIAMVFRKQDYSIMNP